MLKKMTALLTMIILGLILMGGSLAEQDPEDIDRDETETEEVEEDEEEEEEAIDIEAKDLFPDVITEIAFQAGGTVYLRFVPNSTDGYAFFSLNEKEGIDPMGYLYDEALELITANDDNEGNTNFRISYLLERGATYYFACEIVGGTTDTYPVKLEKTTGLMGLIAENVPEEIIRNMKLIVKPMATKGTKVNYQWYQAMGSLEDGGSIDNWDFELIEKQNSATLVIANPEMKTAYSCIARDAEGNGKRVYFYLGENGISCYENEEVTEKEETE